jgi:regulation of enolase protein 1 (concanavalin A-like superfamily)
LEEVYLQIIRRKDYWILHYSNDGSTWKMSRYFKLKMKGRVKAGFESQSPIGNGNKTVFREITIGNKEIKNMRMGK